MIEAQALKALFTKFCPGKALKYKLTSVSELQQAYVLHIVIENTGMEEIVLQHGPVPMILYAFKRSFTVHFFFGLMLQSRNEVREGSLIL